MLPSRMRVSTQSVAGLALLLTFSGCQAILDIRDWQPAATGGVAGFGGSSQTTDGGDAGSTSGGKNSYGGSPAPVGEGGTFDAAGEGNAMAGDGAGEAGAGGSSPSGGSSADGGGGPPRGGSGGLAGAATGGLAAGASSGGGGARNTGGNAGASVGGSGAGSAGAPPVVCDQGGSVIACNNACVDIGTDQHNCRACGHDCGPGSTCHTGLCQPAVLYTGASAYDVDDGHIYFSGSGTESCPNTGCTLSPTLVSTNSLGFTPLFAANDYVAISFPPSSPGGVGSTIELCPSSGCTSQNPIGIAATGKYQTIVGATHSHSDFYVSQNITAVPGDQGKSISRCHAPTSGGCTSTQSLGLLTGSGLIASDQAIFFTATIGGAASALYACPADSLSTCTPTPMKPPNSIAQFAYGTDLYFLETPTGPTRQVSKCPLTGCSSSSLTTVLSFSINSITEFAVDASGVYWITGSSIQMSPFTGAIVTVASNQGTPQQLRLANHFVYWLNGDDNSIRRVAEPAQ